MTFTQLALGISGAIALQLAIFATYAFFKHWQSYLQLREALANDRPAETNRPAGSVAIGTPGWQGLRTFRVIRKVPEDSAGQICSFYLEPEDGKPLPAYMPGQFLTFRLEIPAVPGSGPEVGVVTRCYSLSDGPDEKVYRVSVKREKTLAGTEFPPGKSSNYFHDQVQEGSLLQVRAPSGHFYLAYGNSPVVLIAGGIGLTPMLSMLNWCARTQPEREVWLFYGARNGDELVMLAHLQTLAERHPNFHIHVCFSTPGALDMPEIAADAVHRYAGRVTVDMMRRLLPLKPYHYYLCGPTPMLVSLVPALEEWGVPEANIHYEAFGPASIPRKNTHKSAASEPQNPAVATAFTITFAKSGQQHPWQVGSASLLEFAEHHGIQVDSGCRSGSCGTCQTPIKVGEIRYLQTPDADPDAGTCLLCVCVPATDVTLDA